MRVDAGAIEGDDIPAELDPLICKLIAWGSDREEALARLRRALADTVAVLDGGTTNQGFLLELLDRPEAHRGGVDTGWLDRLQETGGTPAARHGCVALIQAAIELADRDAVADRARFYAPACRGTSRGGGRAVALLPIALPRSLLPPQRRAPRPRSLPRDRRVDGDPVEVSARRLGPHERRLALLGRAHRTLISTQGDSLLVEVDGVPRRLTRDDAGFVYAGPALVVSIRVFPGDIVEAGDVVVVVEAMKMESSLTAPFRARVKEVLAGENVHVDAHAPLLVLEAIEPSTRAPTGDRLSFTSMVGSAEPTPDRCQENLRRMEWLVLGYDIGAAEVKRTIADLHGQCADLLSCDPALIPGEHRLLGMFADLRAVSRPHRADPEPDSEFLHSPQEHLHGWLRSLDVEAEGLPPWFIAALRRALCSLRDCQPRADAWIGGGLLPPVPLPAACRDRVHRDRGDPRPAPRRCRRARR